jgi:Caspase domain
MPLVEVPGRNVGIHALIIGVSDYTHLPGDDDPAEADKFRMKKLKTPALGAFRFLEWLKKTDAEERLIKPLASYDTILAPSPQERALPDWAADTDDAKTENVISRIRAWRARVAANRDNVALFYFTGHGIQRNKDDAVLLLQDFAKSDEAVLESAISFDEIFKGMAPSDRFPDMQMTQIYFVDACRNLPEQIKNFERLKTRPVFDIELGTTDNRKAAPVFFAAVNDSKAFAQVGKGSYFNQALMVALGRGAEGARLVGEKKRWPISIFTLQTAIKIEFSKFKTDQNFELTGRVDDCEFCYLDQAPQVELKIQVQPEDRRIASRIKLNRIGRDPEFTWEQPERAPDHPYEIVVPAGIHQLTVVTGGVATEKGTEIVNQKNRLWPIQL